MVAPVFGLPIRLTSAWIFNCYIIEVGSSQAEPPVEATQRGGPSPRRSRGESSGATRSHARRSAHGLVLVDPGLPVVARQALHLVERDLGRPVSDISLVACTHAHPDHVGGVSTVTAGAEPDIELPDRCRAYLDGERPRTFPLVESALRFMTLYGEQPFSFRALGDFAKIGRTVGFGGPPELTLDFTPTGFLAGGRGPIPGAPGWEAIAAPGHTDDSTCLYHADSATLISGDAVVTQDGVAWFNPEWVDQEASRRTEELLRSLDVRHLLPGHGRPIEASDVWATARSSTEKPSGRGVLARCSRRLGRW